MPRTASQNGVPSRPEFLDLEAGKRLRRIKPSNWFDWNQMKFKIPKNPLICMFPARETE